MATLIKRIRAAVSATPWALQPDKFEAMLIILERAALGQKLSAEEIEKRLDAARIHPNTDKAIANRQGAIGVIPLRGIISNRASMMDDVSPGAGASAEMLTRNIRAAAANNDIKAVVFDCDSPGGNVLGIQEAADVIYELRGKKPMVCQVNATCASAAYWIMSACDEIVCTPSGQVGSIGIFGVHMDQSEADAKDGYKATIISAGKYKAEGNPFQPLSDEAVKALQGDADAYYGMFVDAVARGRGVSAATVRDGYGQGRSVTAAQALELGMIDRIGTMAETLARWGVDITKGQPAKTSAQATPLLNVRRLGLDLL